MKFSQSKVDIDDSALHWVQPWSLKSDYHWHQKVFYHLLFNHDLFSIKKLHLYTAVQLMLNQATHPHQKVFWSYTLCHSCMKLQFWFNKATHHPLQKVFSNLTKLYFFLLLICFLFPFLEDILLFLLNND